MQKMFKKSKKPATGEMALQITSMADIFTIILVFLLKTTAAGISSVSPNGGMTLPVATGKIIEKDTLTLEVNKDSVLVDSKNVLSLSNFEFPLTEIQANGISQSLYTRLIEQRKHRPDADRSSELLVLADESTPYSTLKTVLASAANTGFVDLQLVVVQTD